MDDARLHDGWSDATVGPGHLRHLLLTATLSQHVMLRPTSQNGGRDYDNG